MNLYRSLNVNWKGVTLISIAIICLVLFVQGKPVVDCCCDADVIDNSNNGELWEQLQELKESTFFRSFKVNLHSTCPFWIDDGQCSMMGCAVCGQCDDDDVMKLWRRDDSGNSSQSMSNTASFASSHVSNSFGDAVTTNGLGANFRAWSDDDECLWIQQDSDASYINMALNPESYTGYAGVNAHRVWSAIYDENCFTYDEMCFEQRVFYRLISGLHAAISAHISESYAIASDIDPHTSITTHPHLYGPSLSVFQEKLGKHVEWQDNLYFAFVFLLRAVNKASPMLLTFNYNTGNPIEDTLVYNKVRKMLTGGIISQCSAKESFDETTMFTIPKTQPLKQQFKEHFRNISRIMDCVGCEKCRLHGKLQVLGLGTALKVLFNDAPFTLQRNEVMALIYTLAKFSNALRIIQLMNQRWWMQTIYDYATKAAGFLITAVLIWVGSKMIHRHKNSSSFFKSK